MGDPNHFINEFTEYMLEGCQIIDFDWRYLYLNDTAGRQARLEKKDLIGRKMMEVYPGVEQTPLFAALADCMQNRTSQKISNEFEYPDHSKAWFELSIHPVAEGIIVLSLDVTEHVVAQKRVQKLNRVYAVLSEINQVIVRIHEIHSLFEETCQIAVQKGGFMLACIGLLDAHGKQVIWQASAGQPEGILDRLDIDLGRDQPPPDPLEKSMRSGQVWVNNHLEDEPFQASWQADAQRLGLRSIASFPLVISSQVRGVFNLFSADSGLFDEEEMKLLAEMAMDLSFALEFIEHDQQRQQVQLALNDSEERYRVLVEQAADALFVHDFSGKFVEVNQRACDSLGYTRDELLAMSVFDVEQDFDQAAAQSEWAKIQPGQPFILFGHQRRKNGSTFPVEVHFACLDFQGKRLFMGLMHDITDQRKTEENLRASEAQFRTLIDSAPLAISLSRNSKFLYANSEYLNLHGIASVWDLLGHPIFERVAPQSIEESKKRAYRRSHGLPVEKRYELTGLRKDGAPIPLLAAVSQVNLADGPATIGFFQDISERKQADREIRESEARYRDLFENMLEGFAYCQMLFEDDRPVDFIYLNVNQAFERLTGLGAVTGKKVSEVIPGIQVSNPELIETYGRVSQTGKPERFETFVEPLGIWFSIAVYSTESGTFIAVFDNITERKQVEQEFKQLNAELEQHVQERTAELSDLYNNAPCGYHSLDSAGLIIRINDTELRWLGYSREEVVGKHHITDFFTPASIQVFQQNFPGFIERGWIDNLEFEMVRKDGSILPILLSGTAVMDAQGHYLFSRTTMMDYTQHKEADKEVRDTQARLEAANHELEAFAYSVSHDLRAPLRAIDGFTGIIVEDYAGQLDAEANRLLNIVRANTRKMDLLITDLLAFSRLSRIDLRFSWIDMSAMVGSIYADIAAPQVLDKFNFSVAPLPEAYGDPSLIQQVWVNLLSNAIKYTLPRDECRIEICARQENGMNIYSVRDSGVGFNQEYAHKLFGVFQRLHKIEEFDGTGVGLAIVQRIVHRHGGLVWAEGKVDQGAIFYFSLPQKEPTHELLE